MLNLCFLLFLFFPSFLHHGRNESHRQPPPPSVNYKPLYPWASNKLLAETSSLTFLSDSRAHLDSEPDFKGRAFGRECDAYISVRLCVEGEPVCVDNHANDGEPFFFFYQIVFKRIRQRLPFNSFDRELLTEINVALAQLHPNSWVFIKAFSILCNHFGHAPSVDVFLHFFEAKNPWKILWVSFSGVTGRVILTLFQQSYKGFKGKNFRMCCSEHDCTALDRFPLYWVGKLKLKKTKTLDELSSADCGVCQVLASLGVIFNTAELIKSEYNPIGLAGYIGIGILS